MLDKGKIVESLRNAIHSGELILVIGSGLSVGLTGNAYPALSWKGLVDDGLEQSKSKGKLTVEQLAKWKDMLRSNDIDDLLAAAEIVGRKLGSPNGDLYARWLHDCFSNIESSNAELSDVVVSLAKSGTPMCTLNYDSLLESVTGQSTILLSDVRKSTEWMRKETSGILHLHGHWQTPEGCILGVRDYESTLNDQPRELFQKALGVYNKLLFIGCGDTFADPNFSALIDWLRTHMKSSAHQHYALVLDKQVDERSADESWQGFVEPLGYGSNHSDLPNFLRELLPGTNKPARKKRSASTNLLSKNAEIVNHYRDFVIRDCGQMTIEGVRADMDTAQRRFDLEKLFVPLELNACPPEIPEGDPNRIEKLVKWNEDNSKSVSFGEVFSESQGLALLALPGGGKTLLLKRLAVAYASPGRRLNSTDGLPDIELTPLLIRCREWRDYIKLPLATLLTKMAEITGQPQLAGIYDALVPLLKKGKILLLVDGLDEIHDNAEREIFVDNLHAFLSEYNKIRVVVTSREAGFNLVAPKIASFCKQWRVAPLSKSSIQLLCEYWHRLMTSNDIDAAAETTDVVNQVIRTAALSRLAENPLLLTMLLVVKHGAGRLPPDRVSLYGRAVEVLLNTWNIKGHDALEPKEAVPQLAYVALELMKRGMQTATEKELLSLIEHARDNVPHIMRYAKGTPLDFLKRVELRSSLLLEAGHQVENGLTVPFYQFRHLTFQEYLAAVAVSQGHYEGYNPKHNVLHSLSSKLVLDEWKEVIPMAAVLAARQSGPLVQALVNKGNSIKNKLLTKRHWPEKKAWQNQAKMPAAVGRVLQILIEEANIEHDMLEDALRLVAIFARGAHEDYDWSALCRGPFSKDLLHITWLLYEELKWEELTWMKNTLSTFCILSAGPGVFASENAVLDLTSRLRSEVDEVKCLALMTIVGVLWGNRATLEKKVVQDLSQFVVELIVDQSVPIFCAATWAWGLFRYQYNDITAVPSVEILDNILEVWTSGVTPNNGGSAGFALKHVIGYNRSFWKPKLSDEQRQFIMLQLGPKKAQDHSRFYDNNYLAAVVIAFYSHDLISDTELIGRLLEVRESTPSIVADHVESRTILEDVVRNIAPDGPSALESVIRKEKADLQRLEEAEATRKSKTRAVN
ncbi:SIR2 family protein [Pseudomonas abietaniphila]